MFGSSNPFWQSSTNTNPFGQTSSGTPQGFGHGQSSTAANNTFAPKPFGSLTILPTFGVQTGSSLFATTSTGAFGQQQSTPAFGTTSTGPFGQQQSTPTFGTPSSSPFWSSTPAFGASPAPAFGATSSGSLFGQNPSFGGFGSAPSQSTPFGSTFQQTQPTFGSTTFGASTTPAFGTTTTPAFGTTTPAFGTTTMPAFGATTTPAFGSTSRSLFDASSTPAFGSTTFGTSATGFGTSGTTAFGVSSTTQGFGSSSTPSFVTSARAFSFGSSPSFGQTTVSSGSTPFGATPSPSSAPAPAFGSQTAAPAFGQPQFANQAGGTRIKPYAQTPDVDRATSGTQPSAKLDSISAMPEYKDKSHKEWRWEDYQRGDKGVAPVPPPSDIGLHLGRLLDRTVGADVTFLVGGEAFPAHRAVLAARSPVFEAQLLGSMADARTPLITVQDMEPAAFRAMLQYMYTDSLPADAELGDSDSLVAMMQHLVAAADHYGLDRLKTICSLKLTENVSADTVGSILVFAETFGCPELKKRCLDFFAVENNFKRAAFTDGFFNLVQKYPLLSAELRRRVGL